MILHFWCSHQYLYKAGSTNIPADEATRWKYLRAWYAHMRALQIWTDQTEVVTCLSRSSFPFTNSSAEALIAWSHKSIGNATLGEEPKLMFNTATGLVHMPSFSFAVPLRHSRRSVAPKNKVCLPLADPSCWPLTAAWQADSCSLCCDPNKGPFGDPSCWGRSGRTYERCCQQDFKNVKCEEIRKSTPGCIDCPQTLAFFCEEAHKFDAVKAWQAMNETWHEYLHQMNESKTFLAEVEGNKSLVAEREIPFLDRIRNTVRLEGERFAQESTDAYKLWVSRVRVENDTIAWLREDVRNPVLKNHTVVKRVCDCT